MKRKRPGLSQAIAWIAYNDEPGLRTRNKDEDEIANLISVVLVADLWGKDPWEIADRIIALREMKEE